jgi:hypothetical protein
MRLQCQRGTDEINHGTERFTVSNISWQVTVPDHVGRFMIEDGRAGVFEIEEPDPEHEKSVTCPHCGATFKKE